MYGYDRERVPNIEINKINWCKATKTNGKYDVSSL